MQKLWKHLSPGANVTEEDLVEAAGELANQKQKISSTTRFIVRLLLVPLVCGTIGAGTNRMNVYVVAQATQDLRITSTLTTRIQRWLLQGFSP